MIITEDNGQQYYCPLEGILHHPPKGSEIYITNLPKSMPIIDLINFFSKDFPLFKFRLMMDSNGLSDGSAYATYYTPEQADSAILFYDGYQLKDNSEISVVKSIGNCTLFIGNIPKHLCERNIKEVLQRLDCNVKDVILHRQNDNFNRGFAFVEFFDHATAALAKIKILENRGNSGIICDWALPERHVPDEIMAEVKVVYISNIRLETNYETLKEVIYRLFNKTEIIRLSKVSHYAFVHFTTRDAASRAITKLDGYYLEGRFLKACWGKPPPPSDTPSAVVILFRTFGWGEVSFRVIEKNNKHSMAVTKVLIKLIKDSLEHEFVWEKRTAECEDVIVSAIQSFIHYMFSLKVEHDDLLPRGI